MLLCLAYLDLELAEQLFVLFVDLDHHWRLAFHVLLACGAADALFDAVVDELLFVRCEVKFGHVSFSNGGLHYADAV